MARAFQPGDPRARAAGHKGGTAAARTKQIQAMRRAAVACGCPLTPREARLYRRAYERGYTAGQKTGALRGYRYGWRDALGERKSA